LILAVCDGIIKIMDYLRIGSIIENLNTGLVGEIIRRGSNHLICVTEDGIMFKSWLKDVRVSL